MMVRVLYFAWVRERIGVDEEDVSPTADVQTAAQLVAWLADRSPGHRAALGEPDAIRIAVDQAHVDPGHSVVDAVEVAIFPPVTGGRA